MAAAGNQSVRALMDGLHEGDAGDGTPGPLPTPLSSKAMTKVGLWYRRMSWEATMPTTPGMPRAGA